VLLQVRGGVGAAAATATGTVSDLPRSGQRVVSDLSQDVDGLSRTWPDRRRTLSGCWSWRSRDQTSGACAKAGAVLNQRPRQSGSAQVQISLVGPNAALSTSPEDW